MITLEKIVLKNFFSISNAEINLEDQGLVVVHGRVGSGKTALTCESVLYGLYGTSFEYGQNPGQAVRKNTEKEFSVVVWLRSDNNRFRIMRGKDQSLKLNGLELHRVNDDGTEDRLTRGTSRDTQKLISEGLLKMSERLFRRSVVCSTDMGKFPDASDGEKKSILDELLELWIVQGAYEETAETLKSLKSKLEMANREYSIATERLKEEESYSDHDSDKLKMSLKEEMEVIESKNKELEDLEEAFNTMSEKISSSAKEAKKRIRSVPDNITDEISTIKSSLREISRKKELARQGKCPECGQDTSELCGTHDFGDSEARLSEKLGELASQKKRIEEEIREDEGVMDTLLDKSRKLNREYSELKRSIEKDISSSQIKIVQIKSAISKSEDAEERIRRVKKNIDELSEAISLVRSSIKDEEVLSELFSPKGFRLAIIRSVIPFMNQEAERVSVLLNTPIRVKFSIRGSDESYSGNLSVEVYNPIGAWQYHGSSAGERRTIDIIILMCLMSLNNKRNNRFNHVFFDETFEKLDPPLQRAVLHLLRDISKSRSSVFLITHSATELKQEVDQTWEVNRGGILTINKS